MIYTHLPYSEIKNLTINQYLDLLAMIQTKQVWDLQCNTVAMSNEFDEEANPLYTFNNTSSADKKMTVDEAKKLVSMLK